MSPAFIAAGAISMSAPHISRRILTLTENDSLPVSVDFHVYSLSNVVTVFPFSLT